MGVGGNIPLKTFQISKAPKWTGSLLLNFGENTIKERILWFAKDPLLKSIIYASFVKTIIQSSLVATLTSKTNIKSSNEVIYFHPLSSVATLKV